MTVANAFLDDPPFFLQNQALPYPSYSTDAEELGNPPQAFDNSSQLASGFVHGGTNGSSIDDFRSVIDDLTIQNKKLKERLRKYERSYGAHLEKDRLFEVKFHGLDPGKKRELEETLHAFASSIGKDESTNTSTSQFPSKEDRHAETSLRHRSKNPSSTSTNSRLVDSAYASLSTSGPISLSTANHVGLDKKGGPLPAASKMGKIQSFLDDIPQGLLPKHPTVMTERGKKKLVVRRLEQLFTGKLRVPRGANSQPQQQQEVSNSAARDDRQAIERRGQQVSAEGIREAHILDTEMELERAKFPKLLGESSADSSTASQAGGGERNTDSPSSPDQRPTRPLDLDPDRAQVPSENMEYIRHLGISTPVMASEDSTDFVVDDNHGWVYLNLLINMAQLHIINVTPDFIRSAVTELSTKFQLSSDGRKIRWKGGTEGTELSSDSGADNGLRPSPNDSDSLDEGNQKKRKVDPTARQGSAIEPTTKQGRFSSIPIAGLGRSQPIHAIDRRHNLHYKPLFAHHSSSEDDAMSLDIDDSTSQVSYGPVDDSGTCLTSSGARAMGKRSHSGLLSKRKRDDGVIVFYSGAPFCTDLSGDRENISTPLHASAVDMDGFSNHSHDAIGCRPKKPLRPQPSRTSSGSLFPFRPFKDYSVCAGPIFGSETRSRTPELTKIDEDSNLNFSLPWTSTGEQCNLGPIRLDVCGLGGTRPADHFTYTVETRRRKLDRRTRLKLSRYSPSVPRSQRFLHVISKSSLDTFQSSDDDESIPLQLDPANGNSRGTAESMPSTALPLQAEILSTRYRDLEPSNLPPPATYYGPLSTSTESSDESSSDDNDEDMVGGHRRSQFPVRILHSASPYHPMDIDDLNGSNSISDMEESDTSSLDILVHAREVDSDAVAAKEREYERQASLQPDKKSPATAESVDETSSPVHGK
jgi:hypothetical protein